MMISQQKTLVRNLLGENTARIPIWFLRQAGRYLPEYQEIRARVDFVTLCQTPSTVCEITLQPLRRFDLDAAIIFSDILLLCNYLGQTLSFAKDHGPQLQPTITNARDMLLLKRQVKVESELAFVGDAIALVKSKLQPSQSMIGFAGAPFTVASYMVEGGSSKNYTTLKTWLYTDPKSFVDFLDYIAQHTISYLTMQIQAGADVVMLFDSWADQLPPDIYGEYVLPVTNKILKVCGQQVPIIYFPGAGGDHLSQLQNADCHGIAVHWKTKLAAALASLGGISSGKCLQGNLDPQILALTDKSRVVAHVERILTEARQLACPYIFNVGHGLQPHTRVEAVEWAIEAVRNFTSR